jgi:hypothetical protein
MKVFNIPTQWTTASHVFIAMRELFFWLLSWSWQVWLTVTLLGICLSLARFIESLILGASKSFSVVIHLAFDDSLPVSNTLIRSWHIHKKVQVAG